MDTREYLNTFIGFHRSEIDQSICDRFERIVYQFPERIAISSQGRKVTYTHLNESANRLAHVLSAQQKQNSDPVVLMLDHDTPILTAILGVLKAGKAYVVLEPSLPKARFDTILADFGEPIIITSNQHRKFAATLKNGNCNVVNLEQLDINLPNINLSLSIPSETVAAIFYTSGSTGQPKGVQRTHQDILHRIWLETNDYRICSDDKIALLYSAGFAASVADIFNALLNGATLCLYDFRELGIANLTPWLQREEITMFHLPVALFQQWLHGLEQQEQFPKLRQVTPSGKLYRREVERCWQHLPGNCTLVQRFGASETGMCTRFLVTRETLLSTPVIPAGYPVADTKILLLDENSQPVIGHNTGEIAIKSRYLSSGYWQKPELTKQKFLPDPNDPRGQIYLTGDLGRWQSGGCLEHLGRKDFMVKIRGFRVELGEIETALNQHPQVQGAIVITDEPQPNEKRLVAYITASQDSLNSNRLHRFLATKLPNYMVPSSFVFLDTFPLTPNGKIDRQALPTVDQNWHCSEHRIVAPQTPVEIQLAQTWCDFLKLEQVGIYDNFFELGGHSLLATQIMSRINEKFKLNLLLRNLFEAPTIAELSNRITTLLEMQAASNSLSIQTMEEGEL
ncbi:non-ribosomal peptide synthetase [Leptothoe kymatousa]|uniref:Non-ribosomal peptide synthetase n=1 Tax=Leptothoe kymatousa TAU-MAC 1615 TaxID=2364775 RepID=A0ABS5Y4N9_9CYAN|nr:non-ribosomal peptide synthetase [Leptothoe kymatousa]MBT9312776.1 non-ribosomal peptide synthetase [Leptothoe kymatousa TAU-MAC 1615]